jgi:hypothetical protein
VHSDSAGYHQTLALQRKAMKRDWDVVRQVLIEVESLDALTGR